MDVRDLITDDTGFVSGSIRGTEIHFAVFREFDRRSVVLPHQAVRRVFLHCGILAEDRRHLHDAAGLGRDVGGGSRLRGRLLVDVRHFIFGGLGNIADRIGTAEIHFAVIVELDSTRISSPVRAVERILLHGSVPAEGCSHSHDSVGRIRLVGCRRRFRGRFLVNVGDFVFDDIGFVSGRIGSLE